MRSTDRWLNWINANFSDLEAGIWLRVPGFLPHPLDAGFDELTISEPVGQAWDYALSLDDDSRIHVHEHDDGTLIAHRDRYDPDASPGHALMHVATETTFGKVAGVIGGIILGGIALVGLEEALQRERRT